MTQTGISQILGIWDYLKNSGDHPDSTTMGLTWVGQVGGKREGRRFRGQYVVNQNDVYPNATAGRRWTPTKEHPTPPEPTLFPDRVSYSGWSFDLHNPKGMLDPDHPPYVPTTTPYMFSTPLRALVSKDLNNLFFAGRLASFSHVVYGSQRVMRSCAAAGQAAGTAAAYATAHGVAPASLAADPAAVWSIQQQLIRDDAFIIGVANEDPRDYARTAAVSATSERKASAAKNDTIDGSASNVVSGQNRATNGKLGVAPSNGGRSKSSLATDNLLESTDGFGATHWCPPTPLVFSKQGSSLPPSIYADALLMTSLFHRQTGFQPLDQRPSAAAPRSTDADACRVGAADPRADPADV